MTLPPRWLIRDCCRISQFDAIELIAKTHSLSSDAEDALVPGREDARDGAADAEDMRDGGPRGDCSSCAAPLCLRNSIR
jgi:hypothetical protein